MRVYGICFFIHFFIESSDLIFIHVEPYVVMDTSDWSPLSKDCGWNDCKRENLWSIRSWYSTKEMSFIFQSFGRGFRRKSPIREDNYFELILMTKPITFLLQL